MLVKAKNDLLTQTGPGTSMGDMFRCYWIPALLAEELPGPDCDPVRVKLLSERLIAFRDILAMNALPIFHCRPLAFRQIARARVIETPRPTILVVDRYPEMTMDRKVTTRRHHRKARQ